MPATRLPTATPGAAIASLAASSRAGSERRHALLAHLTKDDAVDGSRDLVDRLGGAQSRPGSVVDASVSLIAERSDVGYVHLDRTTSGGSPVAGEHHAAAVGRGDAVRLR